MLNSLISTITPLFLLLAGQSQSFLVSPHHLKDQIQLPHKREIFLTDKQRQSLNTLAVAKYQDDQFDKLNGEFGENIFFEQFLEDVRNNEDSISTRGQISAYVHRQSSQNVAKLQAFLAQVEDELQIDLYADDNQDLLLKKIFCLSACYLASQEFYHQLVLVPMMGAFKKSGYLNYTQLEKVREIVSLQINRFSADKTNKFISKMSPHLEDEFRQIMMHLLEDSTFMINLAKTKEAITLLTFMASLDYQKDIEKTEHDRILKKMINTAQGLGLASMENLFFSAPSKTNQAIIDRIYNRAENLFDNLSEQAKNHYFTSINELWDDCLDQSNLKVDMTSTTEIWLNQIEKSISKARYLNLRKITKIKPPLLQTYDAGGKIVVIYRFKNSSNSSYFGLKHLVQLSLPNQKMITVDNPKDLARCILSHRGKQAYLFFPDGDLVGYYDELKELEPAVNDAITNSQWNVFGSGSGGLIFANEIVENLGDARHIKKGLGIIPGESGQVFIPNGQFLEHNTSGGIKQTFRASNKGSYIKIPSEASKKTKAIAYYHEDHDIGLSIMSYQLDESIIFFASPQIESFLSGKKNVDEIRNFNGQTIFKLLKIWYDFLELSGAKKVEPLALGTKLG